MAPDWYVTKDGDVSCLELYERHYSCNRSVDAVIAKATGAIEKATP